MSEPSERRLDEFRQKLRQFVADRDWSRFHDPKNLAMALASEAGELLAELRWTASGDADIAVQSPPMREKIEQEVGDVFMSLLLFCERVGIDLLGAAERKLEINARNYPAALSKGRSERPAKTPDNGPFSRVIAVDWSGVASGGHETIWMAEARNGKLISLENGRSRADLTDHLIAIAAADPNIVVGLDFAFAFPAWFAEELGAKTIHDLWRIVEREGESWLRECRPPFWGRPNTSKPSLASHFRETELRAAKAMGAQPKSVFQIGGAGAVGTGSIRGMPQLIRLREAGFAIWPFDAVRRPLAVEIYARLLTGPVVKSSADARASYLSKRFPSLTEEMHRRASSTEAAFDAAVSAMAMAENSAAFDSLAVVDAIAATEGEIWMKPEA